MKGFLTLCRNTRTDFEELVELADAVDVANAARILGRIDGYYSAGRRERLWIATQLVRRLADPVPSEALDDDRWSGPDADARWEEVRQRCLSLAVAIMEEAS